MLIAIDDLQWLDRPSAQIVEFCAKRLVGPVGLIASTRPDQGEVEATPLIAVRLPEHGTVLKVGALPPDVLAELLRRRVPEGLSRSDLRQVSEVSGGNPFYALELAGTIASGDGSPKQGFSTSGPSELLRGYSGPTRRCLIATAGRARCITSSIAFGYWVT